MPPPVITLLTDFGDASAYVAMLKGGLLRRFPDVQLVDLGHHFRARPILEAAFHLLRVYTYYPAGTIHLVGIDEGSARGLRAAAAGQIFLAADNGVLGPVLEREAARVWALAPDNPTTFLARDVLVPAAGGALAPGAEVTDWRRLPLPRPERTAAGSLGQVLHVDRFGNLLTNFTVADLPRPQATAEIGAQRVEGWREDYGAAEGELFLLVGAEGWIEVSAARASAAERLGAAAGTPVLLR